MKFRLLTVAALLISMNAYADDSIPDGLKAKFDEIAGVLTTRTEWPKPGEEFGFKSLAIGAVFDLSSPMVHTFYPLEAARPPRNKEPYSCGLATLGPLVECKLTNWTEGKTPELLLLQSAFGEKVEATFQVLLPGALTPADVRSGEFGSGRIINIRLHNRSPSREFAGKASSFFSGKIGSEPFARTIYRQPENYYSKSCMQSIQRIDAKPIAQLTSNDKNERQRCDGQAKIAAATGRTLSGSKSLREWEAFGGRYSVTLTTNEASTDFLGMALPVANEADIFIELNTRQAFAAWLAEIKNVRARWDVEAQTEAKADF